MKELSGYFILPTDTQANWELHNPIIPTGVLCLESNTKYIKIGDGVSHWNDLSYLVQECFTTTYKALLDNPNIPNGLIMADAAGKIATDRIPPIFKSSYVSFATEAERDAYPYNFRKEGMKCYVVSVKQEYQIVNSAWVNIPTPGAYALLDLLYVNATKMTLTTGVADEQLFASIPLGSDRIHAGDIIFIDPSFGYTANLYAKTLYIRVNGTLLGSMIVNKTTWASSNLLFQWNVNELASQTLWPTPTAPWGHSGTVYGSTRTTIDLSGPVTITVSGKLNASSLTDDFTLYSLWVMHMRKIQ